MSTRSLTLDLHPIFRDGRRIDAALEEAMDEAEARKAKELEIICGKGSGALRKRVLRFLESPEQRDRWHRVTKDPKNHGHVIVSFRWARGQ
jgi:dsDNA-specific endonuclease/ATPase MutS2